MRVNVYAEEMTLGVKMVTKYVKSTKATYYGLRFYLDSSPRLHDTFDDDDRSAVTFWGHKDYLKRLLIEAYGQVTGITEECKPKEGLK
jgi:hypothetical protein